MPARPPRHPNDPGRDVPAGVSGAKRLRTIPITCCLDGQAHDVTDESRAAGQRRGEYVALCEYVISPASMVAPVGRPCARCTAVSTPTTTPVGRPRHRQRGRLWRMLHPNSHAAAGALTRRLP